jgi:two-component system cell cycle response regulator DivK
MTKKQKAPNRGRSDLRFGFSRGLGLFGCQFVSDFDIRILNFISLVSWREKISMDGKKILLVEDNAVNRRLVVFLLRSQGYQIREATSAQEAFDILKTDSADLILMDIQLPGMDGLEATTKLKAEPATANIPVIAVTSYAMAGDREKALAAGCSGYVTKPIDKTIFLAEISRHLK